MPHPEAPATMKAKEDVIADFNEVVNMTASELESWLESPESTRAGQQKDDGSGETVGHDSGRKIIEILKENPTKDVEKYTDEAVDHMRRVVAYWYVHLWPSDRDTLAHHTLQCQQAPSRARDERKQREVARGGQTNEILRMYTRSFWHRRAC